MKLFRKAWVGIVALAALVVGACCTNKTTSNNGEDPNKANNETPTKPSKKELRARIEELRERVKEREMSCVYGSPEVLQRYGEETWRLRHEADSLQNILDHYDD